MFCFFLYTFESPLQVQNMLFYTHIHTVDKELQQGIKFFMCDEVKFKR